MDTSMLAHTDANASTRAVSTAPALKERPRSAPHVAVRQAPRTRATATARAELPYMAAFCAARREVVFVNIDYLQLGARAPSPRSAQCQPAWGRGMPFCGGAATVLLVSAREQLACGLQNSADEARALASQRDSAATHSSDQNSDPLAARAAEAQRALATQRARASLEARIDERLRALFFGYTVLFEPDDPLRLVPRCLEGRVATRALAPVRSSEANVLDRRADMARQRAALDAASGV